LKAGAARFPLFLFLGYVSGGMDAACYDELGAKNFCFGGCFLQYIFHNNLQKILGGIAHNVPAVCDGLAARISKCVAFAGRPKCAGATAWEWSVAE
jgi:hypothetical protein